MLMMMMLLTVVIVMLVAMQSRPRVLRLFGQQLVTRRDSRELEFLFLQDFCRKTMQTVTGQPIKKFNFFSNSPESLLAPTRWPKSLRTLGTRLLAMMIPCFCNSPWTNQYKINTEDSICWWKLWETVESFFASTLVVISNNYFKFFLNPPASCQACDASSLECSTDWTIARGGTESEFHKKVHWILPQVCSQSLILFLSSCF